MQTCRIATALALSVLAIGTATSTLSADATSQPLAEKQAASAVERHVVELLAAIDPVSDLATLQKSFAPKLQAAVAKEFASRKSGLDSTVIESVDGRFVIVVIADAPDGVNGKDVRATSDAEILLVVGGRAGRRPAGGECYGGTSHAEATKGIGIALGGAGGDGLGEGVGSGGGGAAGATGKVGSIALGGAGGKPGVNGGRGTAGSGIDPVRLDSIIRTAKTWNNKH